MLPTRLGGSSVATHGWPTSSLSPSSPPPLASSGEWELPTLSLALLNTYLKKKGTRKKAKLNVRNNQKKCMGILRYNTTLSFLSMFAYCWDHTVDFVGDFERHPCYWTGPAMVLMMVWHGHLVILPRVIASLRLSCKHGKLFSSHSWAMCHPTCMYVMQLLEQGVM